MSAKLDKGKERKLRAGEIWGLCPMLPPHAFGPSKRPQWSQAYGEGGGGGAGGAGTSNVPSAIFPVCPCWAVATTVT